MLPFFSVPLTSDIDASVDSLLESLNFEYCPTGPGGGIDPTCSPKDKNKGVQETVFNNKQVLSDIDTWPNGLAKTLAHDAAAIGGTPNPGERLLIYRNTTGAGTVQGVMLYGTPSNSKAHIYYLASNERGAGTKLMRDAFERAAKDNRDLTLMSTDGAMGFYKKLGMKLTREGFTISPSEMRKKLAE